MDPRGAGGVGRNRESQKAADRTAADRNSQASSGAKTNQYAGYKGPVGTSNANTAVAPGSYGLSSNETKQYNSAKTEYANRGFLGRAFDFMSPVHRIDPQINQPSSYANGTTHYGVNPGGLAAGLIGGAIMPGAGLFTGPLGSAAYDATGQHELVLSGPGAGFSTSYPDGGPGYNSASGYAGPKSDPRAPQMKADQSGVSAFAGAPVSSAPGGAPFGAQPSTAAADPMNAFFRPKVPNHTLPQGFQSAFPNSLSAEDMALLYGQALAK